MAEPRHLIGFKHSVYTWIVRLTLRELGLREAYVEANPFADPPDPVLARFTPLDRVPVLKEGAFTLTETAAICRYLDQISDLPSLVPEQARAQARMAQVIGLVDADVYPILIRQAFSAGYYAPVILGEPGDPERVAKAMQDARPVLSVLNDIAAEGAQLTGEDISLADLHLAPMMSYFMRVPGADDLLGQYPALCAWWHSIAARPTLIETDPLSSH